MTNLTKTTAARALLIGLTIWPGPRICAQASPSVVDIANAPIPIRILIQSPAETKTDLQVICLFRSSPVNTLHGSLAETNEKLKGLLDRVRKPELFGGEPGETLLIGPPKGSIAAKKLLIIGLGDSRPRGLRAAPRARNQRLRRGPPAGRRRGGRLCRLPDVSHA